MTHCGGGEDAAIKLYEWNCAASGAMFEVLSVLEVALRNALPRELTAIHSQSGSDWHTNPLSLLQDRAIKDIKEARERIGRSNAQESPARIVAELNFGFWKYLLASYYEQALWTRGLRNAFPYLQPQSRRKAFDAIHQAHQLRNRIAHHEPIHRRDLQTDLDVMHQVLAWIEPDVRTWAEGFCRVPAVLAVKP